MDLIKEINEKYQCLEAEVDKKLEKVKRDEEKLVKSFEKVTERANAVQGTKQLTYDEAIARNTNILKSLDIAKARLRSRSTFSPVEDILDKAITNYKRDLMESSSLPSVAAAGVPLATSTAMPLSSVQQVQSQKLLY